MSDIMLNFIRHKVPNLIELSAQYETSPIHMRSINGLRQRLL